MLIIVTEYCNKFQPQLSALKNEIAADLIETRDTWKAEDFVNFFKYIRLNRNEEMKQFGQMTFDKFMDLLPIYENARAEALEQFHAKKKVQDANLAERGQGESMKALMGKSLEQISARNEQKGRERQKYQGNSDESFFKQNGFKHE